MGGLTAMRGEYLLSLVRSGDSGTRPRVADRLRVVAQAHLAPVLTVTHLLFKVIHFLKTQLPFKKKVFLP